MFAEQVFDPEGITESGMSVVCASTLRSLKDRHSRDHPTGGGAPLTTGYWLGSLRDGVVGRKVAGSI
jgi:hypothetical protein